MTNNEIKMMDVLAQVVDYVEKTSSMMDEDNVLLCKKCRDKGIDISLENMFYPAPEAIYPQIQQFDKSFVN